MHFPDSSDSPTAALCPLGDQFVFLTQLLPRGPALCRDQGWKEIKQR